MFEVLLAWAALGVAAAVGLLASWAWQAAPLPTAVLVARVATFGFVALWLALPLLPFWPYLSY